MVAVAVVGVYAFSVTYGPGRLVDRVCGFRASEEAEQTGPDLTVHAETAYDHGVPVSSSALATAQKVPTRPGNGKVDAQA
ncbi:ammonium transporter [Streptomyces sp. MUM 136J]|nr:ammonium transporter [Streptomyces sp. MUM 2J]MCH0568217.1 ammonium transporter [Streptomyces sp. MUM 136J]